MTSIGGRQNKEMTSSQMLDSLKNPPTSDDVDTSGSEDDDEEQILETGREGRWQKNNQQVIIIYIIYIYIYMLVYLCTYCIN